MVANFKNTNWIIQIPSFYLLTHITQKKGDPFNSDMQIDPTLFQYWYTLSSSFCNNYSYSYK